jgi:hypothetical protein
MIQQIGAFLREAAITVNTHSPRIENSDKKDYMVRQTQSFFDTVFKTQDMPWYVKFSIRQLIIPGLADFVVWELRKNNIIDDNGIVSTNVISSMVNNLTTPTQADSPKPNIPPTNDAPLITPSQSLSSGDLIPSTNNTDSLNNSVPIN